MFKHIAALIALASVTGCVSVSHMPLTKEASAQLQGKSVSLTQYPTPDFTAFTAGKAAFAVVGAVAMIAEGNSIVKENGIADPAVAIGKGLGEKLSTLRGASVQTATKTAEDDGVPVLLATYPGSQYLLDVKTMAWMFNYYPSDWAHYKVTYNARLRLIDAGSKEVVAETMCKTVQGDDANPPTKEMLLENQAALLKSYLDKAATACVDVLARDVLQL